MLLPTDNSFNSVGFLSPEMQPIVADLRKIPAIANWFMLADGINRTGNRILRDFQPAETIAGRDIAGVALLMRTLSNFQGTIVMAERGMAVEAGTLARCCFENAFVVGTLRKEGDGFQEEMKMEHRFRVKRMARWLVQGGPGRLESTPRGPKQRLEDRIAEIKQAIPGFSPAKFKELAERADLADEYVHYAVLSGDAAHPCARSLDRYLIPGRRTNPPQGMRWGFIDPVEIELRLKMG
jgi:hypothetical protein